MKEYKEPEIQFISLNPSEKVASPCWAYAVNNKPSPKYYYDLEGPGYVSFEIAKNDKKAKEIALFGNGKGCDGGMPCNVYYYYDMNGDKIIGNNECKLLEDDDPLVDKLTEAMYGFGGNSGEPVNPSDFPGQPGNWS